MLNPYKPGDKVRVLVDEPYSTPLHTGDVVTVLEVVTKIEQDGSEIEAVYVSTNCGPYYLALDVVESITAFVPKPAEKDEVIDAFFERLMRSDRELFTLALDANTALSEVDPRVLPADDPHEHTHEHPNDEWEAAERGEDVPGWEQPGEGNDFRVTDFDGDVMEIHYAEKDCPTHGREAGFFFVIEGESVLLPVQYLTALLRWLLDRQRFAGRSE